LANPFYFSFAITISTFGIRFLILHYHRKLRVTIAVRFPTTAIYQSNFFGRTSLQPGHFY